MFKIPLKWSEKLVFEQFGGFLRWIFIRCVNLTSVFRVASPSVIWRRYIYVLFVPIFTLVEFFLTSVEFL